MLENPTPIQFKPRLEDLQRCVPVVSDKALIDLVNGIQVNSGNSLYSFPTPEKHPVIIHHWNSVRTCHPTKRDATSETWSMCDRTLPRQY